MSKLLAYNLTGSPLALAAGNTIATLPASANPPDKGDPVNVTSELRGLSGPDYILLQDQVDARDVLIIWDDVPSYATPGLTQRDAHIPVREFICTNDASIRGDGDTIFNDTESATAFEDCLTAAHDEEVATGRQVQVTIISKGPGGGNQLVVPEHSTPGTYYQTYGKILHQSSHAGQVEFSDGVLFDGIPELGAKTIAFWQFNVSAPVFDTDGVGTKSGVFDPGVLVNNSGKHRFFSKGSSAWCRYNSQNALLIRSGGMQFIQGDHWIMGPNASLEVTLQSGAFGLEADCFISESPNDGEISVQMSGGHFGNESTLFDQQPRFSGLLDIGPNPPGFLIFPPYPEDGTLSGIAPFASGAATLVADDGGGKNSEITGIDLTGLTDHLRLYITSAGLPANTRIVMTEGAGDANGVKLKGRVLADEGPVAITVTHAIGPNQVTRLGASEIVALPNALAAGQSSYMINFGAANVAVEKALATAINGPENVLPGMMMWAYSIAAGLNGNPQEWDTQLLGHQTEAPDSPASGAISVLGLLSKLTVNTNAYSLVDGLYEGQVKKVIAAVVTGGTAVLTPANLEGALTTITFASLWDSVELTWLGGAWHVSDASGPVIA